jgi:hypothetical protein
MTQRNQLSRPIVRAPTGFYPDCSTILELEAGKIRRESDYWDEATFMKQVDLPASNRLAQE